MFPVTLLASSLREIAKNPILYAWDLNFDSKNQQKLPKLKSKQLLHTQNI